MIFNGENDLWFGVACNKGHMVMCIVCGHVHYMRFAPGGEQNLACRSSTHDESDSALANVLGGKDKSIGEKTLSIKCHF